MTDKSVEEARREFVDAMALEIDELSVAVCVNLRPHAEALLAALERENDKPEPPKRTAEDLIEQVRNWLYDTPTDRQPYLESSTLTEALRLVRELRAERDEMKRRIEKAKATCSSWTTSNAFDKISEMHRILRGEA